MAQRVHCSAQQRSECRALQSDECSECDDDATRDLLQFAAASDRQETVLRRIASAPRLQLTTMVRVVETLVTNDTTTMQQRSQS